MNMAVMLLRPDLSHMTVHIIPRPERDPRVSTYRLPLNPALDERGNLLSAIWLAETYAPQIRGHCIRGILRSPRPSEEPLPGARDVGSETELLSEVFAREEEGGVLYLKCSRDVSMESCLFCRGARLMGRSDFLPDRARNTAEQVCLRLGHALSLFSPAYVLAEAFDDFGREAAETLRREATLRGIELPIRVADSRHGLSIAEREALHLCVHSGKARKKASTKEEPS